MVDVENPDLATYPAFGRVRGLECVLEPGEALFMPSYVWYDATAHIVHAAPLLPVFSSH
jgi:hypothetical protein